MVYLLYRESVLIPFAFVWYKYSIQY
ncbi:hypothetical protein ACQ27_gp454 [Klebsiella phage K64-1]|nr:hypothetical protein ACQ27_gp454 [Klebsiella phage K64-1]